MSPTPEVRNLIARCLDGVASDAEAAELGALVTRDPDVARDLARAAAFESDLEVVARTQPAPPVTDLGRAGRRRTLWAGAAVAVAASLVFAWSRWDRAGEVGARPSPPIATPSPMLRSPLHAPEAATTPDHRVRFDDGSIAELRDDGSRLQTRLATATAVDVALENGGARFDIVPRPSRRFRVWVGSAYVEVLGTVFSVDRLAAGMRVSVERGLVRVVSGRSETRVAAGAAHVITFDKPAAAPSVRDEVGGWLHASELARRNSRSEEALALLRRVLDRHPGDPRAPYASFIMGRVLLEELGRPRDAAAAFARVPVLDAKTPLVQDALAREVESWARAGDEPQLRVRARAYLQHYPNGGRADEVRRYSRME